MIIIYSSNNVTDNKWNLFILWMFIQLFQNIFMLLIINVSKLIKIPTSNYITLLFDLELNSKNKLSIGLIECPYDTYVWVNSTEASLKQVNLIMNF